jgi:hypothetical protein
MNNITFYDNKTIIYQSIDFWFKSFGSQWYQEIIYLTLVPIGIVGILLNILVLVILRSDTFSLTFYTYLRAYTLTSVFVCFLVSTRFVQSTRHTFKFSNTYAANAYVTYFFIPMINTISMIGNFLDVALSIQRVVLLLSKGADACKKINPIFVCFLFGIISPLLCIPFWFNYEPVTKEIHLNETKTFMIHYYSLKYSCKNIRLYLDILTYVFDVIPIIVETTCSITSIVLIKKHVKRKIRLVGNNLKMNNGDTNSPHPVLTPINAIIIATPINGVTTFNKKATISKNLVKKNKKMETKLTILVIFMSILSTM